MTVVDSFILSVVLFLMSNVAVRKVNIMLVLVSVCFCNLLSVK